MNTAEKLNRTYSVEEYFELEKNSEVRHDFHLGEVFALAGTSKDHNRIKINLVKYLDDRINPEACMIHDENIRTELVPQKTYVYPDIVVSCDDEDRLDKYMVTHPKLIMEVLSPGTEYYDRGFKLLNYQRIPSLQQYVLLSQDIMQVESYSRNDDNSWKYETFTDPEDVLAFPSLGIGMTLFLIYQYVNFPSDQTATS